MYIASGSGVEEPIAADEFVSPYAIVVCESDRSIYVADGGAINIRRVDLPERYFTL